MNFLYCLSIKMAIVYKKLVVDLNDDRETLIEQAVNEKLAEGNEIGTIIPPIYSDVVGRFRHFHLLYNVEEKDRVIPKAAAPTNIKNVAATPNQLKEETKDKEDKPAKENLFMKG